MNKLSKDNQAIIFGLGAVLLWSTVATAFSISLKHLSPTQLLLFANIVSLIFLIALLTMKGELKLFFSYAKQSWKASLFLAQSILFYIT
jgi:EamA domain-containing membrane protein RarD